jgi:hypothetical protein
VKPPYLMRLLLAGIAFVACVALLGDRRSTSENAVETLADGMAELPEHDDIDAGLASEAETRLHLFRTGTAGDRLALRGEEITAVLRYTVPGVIPPGVGQPVVRLADGNIRVNARLSAAVFPGTPLLAPVLGVLPDSIDVELRGRLAREGRRALFLIDRVYAERMPVPRSVVASIVSSLGMGGVDAVDEATGETLPALRVAWPHGVTAMDVTGDRLVLRRGTGTRSVDDGDDG